MRCRQPSAPSIKARQGVELITSGELRVVDEEGRDVPRDGATVGEIVVRGNVVMKGYYNDPEATAHGAARRLLPQRRRRGRASRRLRRHPRSAQGRHHQRRREHLVGRSRRRAAAPSRRAGSGGRRPAGREMGRGAARVRRAEARRARRRRTNCARSRAIGSRTSRRRTAVTFVAELPKTATGKIQKFVLRGGRAGDLGAVERRGTGDWGTRGLHRGSVPSQARRHPRSVPLARLRADLLAVAAQDVEERLRGWPLSRRRSPRSSPSWAIAVRAATRELPWVGIRIIRPYGVTGE